jgi:hypothetical protein
MTSTPPRLIRRPYSAPSLTPPSQQECVALDDGCSYHFGVRVEFVKLEDKGRCRCRWEALRGKRTRVPGTTMAVGKDIPHDLGQYVVEAAAGYGNGFWGLVARGATFKSTGRRRTKPGRALIATHRPELLRAEHLAGLHLGLWKANQSNAVSDALDRAFEQWQALQTGERLVFHWPSEAGRVEASGASESG